jgi:hypothetical protein
MRIAFFILFLALFVIGAPLAFAAESAPSNAVPAVTQAASYREREVRVFRGLIFQVILVLAIVAGSVASFVYVWRR